jgi:hypothetical protein
MGEKPDLWTIYFVPNCRVTLVARYTSKDKLVAIVCTDGNPRGFLINSEIDAWIQIDTDKMATQVKILASEHPCLHRDSYVHTMELFMFEESELGGKRDPLSPSVKQAIQEAVAQSKFIEGRYKKLICP